MGTEHQTGMTSNGKQPVFEGLQVHAELLENLSITTITQRYRNPGKKNIEAVYTFPLPFDAVLLDMKVTLGDEILKGTVLPKKQAERQYEEAITDGDAPVMLQNPQPGVYSMNIGNLLPGEQAVITIRYGMFMSWQGDTLRYYLPTTIAPRYGSARKGRMAPHQEPETSLAVDNMFKFEMKVSGLLAGMAIESPSHGIEVDLDSSGTHCTVQLSGGSGTFMDRDLIITVRKDCSGFASAFAVQDGDSTMIWGSFQPSLNLPEDPAPRSIKIVVDCSGSMSGDSILQAKEAILRILDELRPQDWFNIVAFGDNTETLFNAQVKVTSESLAFARGYIRKLDARMGGTEIEDALKTAVRLKCRKKMDQYLLLITDGEIWNWDRVVQYAENSEHRFFTVGVGSAVSEAFVRTLAERTGGACELVNPNEQMTERIHRHFRRIVTPFASAASAAWPSTPLRQLPDQLPRLHNGDTFNLFAWFSKMPHGEVVLHIPTYDGDEHLLTAPISSEGTFAEDLPRMAAALRLRHLDSTDGEELAVQYQLMSRWTNYLAIVQREDNQKADTLPELHKVQQMLAAGWGGTGSTRFAAKCAKRVSSAACYSSNITPPSILPSSSRVSASVSFEFSDDFDVKENVEKTLWIWDVASPVKVQRFIGLLDEVLGSGMVPGSIELPLLPDKIHELLNSLVNKGINEHAVVVLFLYFLSESEEGDCLLSRQSKRVILKAYKSLGADSATEAAVREKLLF